jgi:hypothetical protein
VCCDAAPTAAWALGVSLGDGTGGWRHAGEPRGISMDLRDRGHARQRQYVPLEPPDGRVSGVVTRSGILLSPVVILSCMAAPGAPLSAFSTQSERARDEQGPRAPWTPSLSPGIALDDAHAGKAILQQTALSASLPLSRSSAQPTHCAARSISIRQAPGHQDPPLASTISPAQ